MRALVLRLALLLAVASALALGSFAAPSLAAADGSDGNMDPGSGGYWYQNTGILCAGGAGNYWAEYLDPNFWYPTGRWYCFG